MKYYICGFGIALVAVIADVISPLDLKVLDVLLEPGASLAGAIPGGVGHNPLNFLILLGIQTLLYSAVLRIIHWSYRKLQRSDTDDFKRAGDLGLK